MKVANVEGRAHIDVGNGWIDIAQASAGRFPSDPMAAFEQWEDVCEWGRRVGPTEQGRTVTRFDVPVPRPRQIFAIGLNYRAHAAESRLPVPDEIMVFTKYVSSLTHDQATVVLPNSGIDWEVELVVVVGRSGHDIPRGRGWDHVAGLTVGQDLSWRELQLRGNTPQFSLSKSLPGFSPLGPIVVTPDEFPNRDDIGLACRLDGETLQSARTSDLVFGVGDVVERLSQTVPLLAGDLIFTGTPQGVGMGRTPPRYLVPGTLVSEIEQIGTLTVHLVSGAEPQ